MSHDRDLASQVRQILVSTKNDEPQLQEAADLARVDAPVILRKLTARFEAYFAVATLLRSISSREERETIDRRRAHAIELVDVWAASSSDDSSRIDDPVAI